MTLKSRLKRIENTDTVRAALLVDTLHTWFMNYYERQCEALISEREGFTAYLHQHGTAIDRAAFDAMLANARGEPVCECDVIAPDAGVPGWWHHARVYLRTHAPASPTVTAYRDCIDTLHKMANVADGAGHAEQLREALVQVTRTAVQNAPPCAGVQSGRHDTCHQFDPTAQ